MSASNLNSFSLQDSYQPLTIKIQIVDDGNTTDIPSKDYFQSLEVEVLREGAWNGTLTLFDQSGELLMDRFYRASAGQKMILQWGWQNDKRSNDYAMPQYHGMIASVRPTFTPQGVTMQYNLLCTAIASSIRDSSTGAQTFPKQPASTTFQQIADQWGWTIDQNLFQTGDDDIKPLVRPAGMSHWDFIQQVLLKYAVNGKDQYLCGMDPTGKVWFCTQQYAQQNNSNNKTAKDYIWARDLQGEVINFSPSDDSLFGYLYGAGDTKFIGMDDAGGKPVAIQGNSGRGVAPPTDPGQSPNVGSNMPPSIKGGESVQSNIRNDTSGGGSTATAINSPDMSIQRILSRDPDDTSAQAQVAFARASEIIYYADLEVMGTHDVYAMDTVSVTAYTPQNQPHYLSGLFRVLSMKHQVGSTGWTSSMSLARRGFINIVQKQSDTGNDTLPTYNAPDNVSP